MENTQKKEKSILRMTSAFSDIFPETEREEDSKIESVMTTTSRICKHCKDEYNYILSTGYCYKCQHYLNH